MNILVTGGAGYIGSHFCLAAKAMGFTPITLDNLSTGHKHLVKWGPLERVDIRDTYKVEKVMREHKVEAVVHFAAKSLVGESMGHPDLYYSNNVSGLLSVLRAMKEAGVRKIVFSSSAATYGESQSELINESHPQSPINPYGRSKLICEQILSDHFLAFGIQYAILRYFNVIGANADGQTWEDHNPETHLVPNLIQSMIFKKPFLLTGQDHATHDGTAIRDYVDVCDLADVHLAALDYLRAEKKLVSNVGLGRGYSVKEVVDAATRIWRLSVDVEIKPRRLGDPARLVADARYFNSWYKKKLKTLDESLLGLMSNYKARGLV